MWLPHPCPRTGSSVSGRTREKICGSTLKMPLIRNTLTLQWLSLRTLANVRPSRSMLRASTTGSFILALYHTLYMGWRMGSRNNNPTGPLKWAPYIRADRHPSYLAHIWNGYGEALTRPPCRIRQIRPTTKFHQITSA